MTTPTPNKENLRKWAEALESGRFSQGKGRLNQNNQLCCLGVACEVAIENGLKLHWVVERDDIDTIVWYGEPNELQRSYGTLGESETVLPTEVQEWLGIDDRNPDLRTPNSSRWYSATTMNDNVHLDMSFADIAAAIRHTYDIPKEESNAE